MSKVHDEDVHRDLWDCKGCAYGDDIGLPGKVYGLDYFKAMVKKSGYPTMKTNCCNLKVSIGLYPRHTGQFP